MFERRQLVRVQRAMLRKIGMYHFSRCMLLALASMVLWIAAVYTGHLTAEAATTLHVVTLAIIYGVSIFVSLRRHVYFRRLAGIALKAFRRTVWRQAWRNAIWIVGAISFMVIVINLVFSHSPMVENRWPPPDPNTFVPGLPMQILVWTAVIINGSPALRIAIYIVAALRGRRARVAARRPGSAVIRR